MNQPHSIRVLQITDLHLKADPKAQWRGHIVQDSLEAILQLASQDGQWPPELILVTGDIVDDETPEGYKQAYQRLAMQIRETLGASASETTLAYIPGNHDNAALLEASCQQLGIKGCGVFTLKNWQIIQLDSSLPDSDDGELGKTQLAKLDDALEQPHADNTLIVLHHPLVKLGSAWLDTMRIKDADELFKRVDAFNEQAGSARVRGIVWGHAHQQSDLMHKEISLFGTPAAGPVQFTAGSNDFAIDTELTAGLRWLTLHEDGRIETQVCRLPHQR